MALHGLLELLLDLRLLIDRLALSGLLVDGLPRLLELRGLRSLLLVLGLLKLRGRLLSGRSLPLVTLRAHWGLLLILLLGLLVATLLVTTLLSALLVTAAVVLLVTTLLVAALLPGCLVDNRQWTAEHFERHFGVLPAAKLDLAGGGPLARLRTLVVLEVADLDLTDRAHNHAGANLIHELLAELSVGNQLDLGLLDTWVLPTPRLAELELDLQVTLAAVLSILPLDAGVLAHAKNLADHFGSVQVGEVTLCYPLLERFAGLSTVGLRYKRGRWRILGLLVATRLLILRLLKLTHDCGPLKSTESE